MGTEGATPNSSAGLVPVRPGGAGAIIQAMHGKGGMGIEIPKPFSQPICLVPSIHIADTTHMDDIEGLVPKLSASKRLSLVRERDNRYDERCIRVNTSAGGRLGFVPEDINEIPARLMDGGKALYAEVNKVEKIGGWWKIGMGVWLDD